MPEKDEPVEIETVPRVGRLQSTMPTLMRPGLLSPMDRLPAPPGGGGTEGPSRVDPSDEDGRTRGA